MRGDKTHPFVSSLFQRVRKRNNRSHRGLPAVRREWDGQAAAPAWEDRRASRCWFHPSCIARYVPGRDLHHDQSVLAACTTLCFRSKSQVLVLVDRLHPVRIDRTSTRLNSSTSSAPRLPYCT